MEKLPGDKRRNATALRILGLALTLLFIWPLGARAGTITFFDLTDTITFTDDTGRTTDVTPQYAGSGCGTTGVANGVGPLSEVCYIQILAPAGNVTMQAISNYVNFFWAEPGQNSAGPILSDGFSVLLAESSRVQVEFFSDLDGSPTVQCASINTVCSVEDGTVQTAFSETWTLAGGGTVVDTIKFQSDAGVPEPSTTLLTLTGLGVLGLTIRRKALIKSDIAGQA